ncbi:MAG: DUF1097 domain-containing protein [Actinobacteria bacterium]|nr:DUF1097 domain-containing protein [Actinomycetota bacterium]MCG2819936.1 DUF1097 domain-containing protein [Actinomycetes bacterium]MBU4218753.1 DUF1097 domain-containing protein [Actinomycetota bacterium]MBU4359526.1 DUF1097 domain-containing protein [Actinomycetota bacterium]MBU4391736.1 DUF1097 domain-containing protein [Actinomycetota bacterium]
MDRLKSYQKNLILAVALAVMGFLWIWLYQYIGGAGYWAALVVFAVYVAAGSELKKLPWMVLGGVVGVVLGLFTYVLAMAVFPPYAVISAAIAGAIFLLVAGLISVPKLTEILPMTVVGWASFLAVMAQFDYMFMEKFTSANQQMLNTFFGVLLSVLVGLLFAALVATPLLGDIRKKQAAQQGEGG